MPVLIIPNLWPLLNLGLILVMFFTIAACGRIGRLEPPPDYQPPPASADNISTISTQTSYMQKAIKKIETSKQKISKQKKQE